jgi:hypothetical protein
MICYNNIKCKVNAYYGKKTKAGRSVSNSHELCLELLREQQVRQGVGFERVFGCGKGEDVGIWRCSVGDTIRHVEGSKGGDREGDVIEEGCWVCDTVMKRIDAGDNYNGVIKRVIRD